MHINELFKVTTETLKETSNRVRKIDQRIWKRFLIKEN